MYKAAHYLLLPLMWINITAGENQWDLFGLGVGQIFYWMAIALAWLVASRSPYQIPVTIALFLAVALRMLELLGGGAILDEMRVAALAVIFTVAGAVVYGKNWLLLHRQLVIFLGLCLPVMLLQILGISSFVMGWGTGYAHDSAFDISDIGRFADVPLFPTLFVGFDELHYSIGQGRPVGLMHSNNVLSIFVVIAGALNLAIPRTSRTTVADLLITGVAVLTMSKMVLAIMILLYFSSVAFGVPARRRLGLKLLIGFAAGMALYYFLFPGLLAANFSEEMIVTSVLLRLLGVMQAAGLDGSALFYGFQAQIASVYREEESYSAIALLLKSEALALALVGMAMTVLLYIHRVRQLSAWPVRIYVVTFLACVLTQFAIPFVAAPSFQFIAGFALFPLLKQLWRPAARGHGWISLLLRARPPQSSPAG